MNSLERLKAAMQTETTIAAIAKKARVPIAMVQFHLKKVPSGKRSIVEKTDQ
ncbi:hypothetical protein ACKFKG_03140 [Phormidesmis sp. 146-35]